jgi:hypothetical protein
MSNPGNDLRPLVEKYTRRLMTISADCSLIRPGPQKWSAIEILGHLVDSAANNHQRFVRALFQSDMVFDAYDQNSWVNVQNYQSREWQTVITFWHSYNLHLDLLIKEIPEKIRMLEVDKHNLDQIAWQAVPVTRPVTLEYFVKDYIAHMEHHLAQIFKQCRHQPGKV